MGIKSNLLAAIALVLSNSANTATAGLTQGDILVTDWSTNSIFRVDPVSGAQTVLSSGGFMSAPGGMEIDANGDILIANYNALGGSGAIIRIDPFSGAQSIISSGGFFSNPAELTLDTSGNIFVADQSAFGTGGIIKVDPLTGVQTVVTSTAGPFGPIGLAFDASGQLLSTSAFTSPSIVSIDPISLAQTPVFHSGLIFGPGGLEVESDGNILVSDIQVLAGNGSIQRIDPNTGIQTTVSSGGNLSDLYNIAIDGGGDILAANGSGEGAPAVIRVDPVSGAQTVVSSGGSLGSPVGIFAVLQSSGPAPDVSTSTDTIDSWDEAADWGGGAPATDDAVVISTTSGGTISGPTEPTTVRSLELVAELSPAPLRLVLYSPMEVTHGLTIGSNTAISGATTVKADVINEGSILPGFSPGELIIDGNYIQEASGTLTVELGGLLPGDEYDVLNITGTAILDGILDIDLYDLGSGLFTPSLGDTFDFLSAENITGDFNLLSYAALGNGLGWQLDYLYDEIGTTDLARLTVVEVSSVPVPAAVWLFGSGLLGLIGVARRKKA